MPAHDPDAPGMEIYQWDCPRCSYHTTRYGKSSLEQAKVEHMAAHARRDREEREFDGKIYSKFDREFFKSIGVKV